MERRCRRHQQMQDGHEQRQQQKQHDQNGDAPVEAAHEEARSDHASTARPLSAKRPRGRFWMNRMMSTSTRILPSTAPA